MIRNIALALALLAAPWVGKAQEPDRVLLLCAQFGKFTEFYATATQAGPGDREKHIATALSEYQAFVRSNLDDRMIGFMRSQTSLADLFPELRPHVAGSYIVANCIVNLAQRRFLAVDNAQNREALRAVLADCNGKETAREAFACIAPRLTTLPFELLQ